MDVQKILAMTSKECFAAHRGAFWWDEPSRTAVAFGNDGYATDRRSHLEVEALRQFLAHYGGKELGFAKDAKEGYSWALGCELPPDLTPDLLDAALRFAWDRLSHARHKGQELTLDGEGGIAESLRSGQFHP